MATAHAFGNLSITFVSPTILPRSSEQQVLLYCLASWHSPWRGFQTETPNQTEQKHANKFLRASEKSHPHPRVATYKWLKKRGNKCINLPNPPRRWRKRRQVCIKVAYANIIYETLAIISTIWREVQFHSREDCDQVFPQPAVLQVQVQLQGSSYFPILWFCIYK